MIWFVYYSGFHRESLKDSDEKTVMEKSALLLLPSSAVVQRLALWTQSCCLILFHPFHWGGAGQALRWKQRKTVMLFVVLSAQRQNRVEQKEESQTRTVALADVCCSFHLLLPLLHLDVLYWITFSFEVLFILES